MLHTYEIPEHFGRIRFVTEQVSKQLVTVECFDVRRAFTMEVPLIPQLTVGQRVRISGKVRMDPGMNKSGELREKNLAYLHDPFDGSPREHWIFFMLLSPVLVRLPPDNVLRSIQACKDMLEAHERDWYGNLQTVQLAQTIDMCETTKSYLQRELRSLERERAPVKALDIAI